MIFWIIVNVRWERLVIIKSYLSIIAPPIRILGQFRGHGWISKWRKHLSAGCFAIPSYWSTMIWHMIYIRRRTKKNITEIIIFSLLYSKYYNFLIVIICYFVWSILRLLLFCVGAQSFRKSIFNSTISTLEIC